MNGSSLKLTLLLTVLALTNLAADEFFGFGVAFEPECDCEEEGTFAPNILLTTTSLNLTMGQSESVGATFRLGTEARNAQWSMRKPAPDLVSQSSLGSAGGETTQIQLTAGSSVIPDENWDQGTQYREDSPTIRAEGTDGSGSAEAVLNIKVWGTQLYWSNPDGSVRTWWDSVAETINPFGGGGVGRTSLTDGLDSQTYYLVLNVPGGASATDWDFEVITYPVQVLTIVDDAIPGYQPFGSVNSPAEYLIEPHPPVLVNNGVLSVTFDTREDFPEWPWTGSAATMPFEIVATRKSDGLQVRQRSSLTLSDT